MEAGLSEGRIVTVGIDNGLTGGLVAVNEGNLVKQVPLPVKDGDLNATEFINRIQSLGYPSQVRIAIEEPGKFAPGVFALCSTWKIFGQITGSLRSHGYTYTAVAPRSWQAKMLGKIPKGETKKFALDCYVRTFSRQPPTKTDRSKKPHDGIVDAALIATYAERYLWGYEEVVCITKSGGA
jgi:hypothetical protein